jgi:hypothetical protein
MRNTSPLPLEQLRAQRAEKRESVTWWARNHAFASCYRAADGVVHRAMVLLVWNEAETEAHRRGLRLGIGAAFAPRAPEVGHA